jgi:hypothetical protein
MMVFLPNILMPALRACLHVKLAAPHGPVELNAQPATIVSRYRETEEG